jgi:hypothetical protein
MTAATETQPTSWNAPDTRRGQRPRPARAACALCSTKAPATPLGLCSECLAAAAAEHVLITPASDRRADSVQARDLCRRCGSGRDSTSRCDA